MYVFIYTYTCNTGAAKFKEGKSFAKWHRAFSAPLAAGAATETQGANPNDKLTLAPPIYGTTLLPTAKMRWTWTMSFSFVFRSVYLFFATPFCFLFFHFYLNFRTSFVWEKYAKYFHGKLLWRLLRKFITS